MDAADLDLLDGLVHDVLAEQNGIAFADTVNKAGGKAEVVDLPKVGIKGNSHMVMMDRNSSEVAALIQAWLEKQGVYK